MTSGVLKLAADEDFNNDIIRGLRRRRSDVDVVRVQDVGLSGASDPAILAWAADEGRVLLTHDVSTMTRYAYKRVAASQTMPGLFEVARTLPVAWSLKIFSWLLNAASRTSGKGRYTISHLGNAHGVPFNARYRLPVASVPTVDGSYLFQLLGTSVANSTVRLRPANRGPG